MLVHFRILSARRARFWAQFMGKILEKGPGGFMIPRASLLIS